MVEAFGAVRSTDEFGGFNEEQKTLIALKFHNEWLGKNPQTYSEYDLMTMGEIICQLQVNNIAEIHPTAFK